MTRIKNYVEVKKIITGHYDKEQQKLEKSLAIAKDFLERIRKGESNLKWPDTEFDVTEQSCVNRINNIEKFLKPSYRGRPRKQTLLHLRAITLARLEAADKAPVFTGLKVKIEWKKSRTWGNTPIADCWVFGGEGSVIHHNTGRAYGCGYDKRSAAVDKGIECPTIDRLIIENKKTWELYAVDGKDCFPYLSIGGKGIGTLQRLFVGYGEKPPIPGFEWTWEEGKTWDFIEVRPKEKRK